MMLKHKYQLAREQQSSSTPSSIWCPASFRSLADCFLLFMTLLLTCGLGSMASADHRQIDFANDIVPVLTKHGCNSGACHGAAIGRGGFKLSLYGGDPLQDYEAIVLQESGRRVNLVSPESSLLVLKPSEQIAHGGGTRFDWDSRAASMLAKWIENGAQQQSRRTLEHIELKPKRRILPELGHPVPLQVIAHYTADAPQDVTDWTVFTAEDESAVEIENGIAKVQRPGRHIVVARYLHHVVPIELIVPYRAEIQNELASDNAIDQFVQQKLDEVGILAASRCSDQEFLRRISLDLTGQLPTASQRNALGESDWSRIGLVDELLESEEFTNYWTFQLAKLLRLRPQINDTVGLTTYHEWLKKQVRQDTSYDEIARQLLLAAGDTHENGPANFYLVGKNAGEQAEFISELFMASRLRCANCHNHPLDKWTQDDYHGLAAILAKVSQGRTIDASPNGIVIHPRTKEPAVAKIPGESLQQPAGKPIDRQGLTRWLTSQENPYFAKAIVNRLWKHMLGRGLVEPVDDFRDTNPATHPELLDWLANDFVTHGYSLRHSLRQIALSQTYARSAQVNESNAQDNTFYSHAMQRPLEAEVLADAVADVLGENERYGDLPAGTRAVSLVNPETQSVTLDVLGRCNRKLSCETSSGIGGLSQKLHLFNGKLLNGRLAEGKNRISQLLRAGKTPIEVIEFTYESALARPPNAEERLYWQQQLDAAANAGESSDQLIEDFLWAMLTCQEFVTNH